VFSSCTFPFFYRFESLNKRLVADAVEALTQTESAAPELFALALGSLVVLTGSNLPFRWDILASIGRRRLEKTPP
jgi:2-hydroxychromene-2-carboxylate isomerase